MIDTILKGFEYAFTVNPQLRDDSCPRAGFVAFQTYPQNNVQGGGTLVGVNANKYWRITSGPQVIQLHSPIAASAIGGGSLAGGIIMQPLLDTSGSSL